MYSLVMGRRWIFEIDQYFSKSFSLENGTFSSSDGCTYIPDVLLNFEVILTLFKMWKNFSLGLRYP